MGKNMLPCPVAGCDRRRSSEYMMCRPDWWRVSPSTRAEVYAAWRAYGSERIVGGEASAAYLEILGIAIGEAEASRAKVTDRGGQ